MTKQTRSGPWFVAHVAATLGAVVCIAVLAGFPSAWMLGVTGALLVAAGVTALVGKRSLLRTRAADVMVAVEHDPAQVQRADALLLGIVLSVLGGVAVFAAVTLLV